MKTIVLTSLGLLLGACAAYDGALLRAGTSTEADVRHTMGPPALEFANDDGSHELIYPRGPLGTQTFIAHLAKDGVLRGIEPVLTDDRFYQIHPGLTRDDVLRLIGPPGQTMEFPRLRQVAWDYRYVDTWGYVAIFSVTFDENGVVVSKITRRLGDRNRFSSILD